MAGRPRKPSGGAGNETDGSAGDADRVEETISGAGSAGGAASDSSGVETGLGSGEGGIDQAAKDPAEASGPEAPRKKRGRPPGSGKGKSAPAPDFQPEILISLDARVVAAQLQGAHAGIAALTREPEFLLRNEQAALLGNAVAETSKYYNFAPNGKIMSLLSLGAAAMIVYVPMFATIRAKRRATREVKPDNAAPDAPSPEREGVYDFTKAA